MTKFINEHPGGKEHILKAAGGAIDDHWAHWAYHKARVLVWASICQIKNVPLILFEQVSSKVPPLLEAMRIGTLLDGDQPEEAAAGIRASMALFERNQIHVWSFTQTFMLTNLHVRGARAYW